MDGGSSRRETPCPGSRVQFTTAALTALMEYDWRGNVRQLQNVLARALILSASGRIEEHHLDLPRRENLPRLAPDGPPEGLRHGPTRLAPASPTLESAPSAPAASVAGPLSTRPNGGAQQHMSYKDGKASTMFAFEHEYLQGALSA